MRVIIAGSRHGCPERMLDEAIAMSGFNIDTLVCGMGNGVDTQAFRWAKSAGIPIAEFPAQWMRGGFLDRKAGPDRNRKMAAYAEALIALPGGKGTANMIEEARKRGLKVYEHIG